MMKKISLIALSVGMACWNTYAEDLTLAMVSPSPAPQALTLANGDRLASSRYAGIITPESETVRVIFDGVTEAELSADISLDSVRFENNEKFRAFLKSAGVRDNYLEKILQQNRNGGFVHSANCKGARSECVVISKGIDFVIDYYNSTVRLFVAPELLRQSSGDVSYLVLNGGPGLVNNLSAYYYDSFGRYEPSYYIRDQGVSGYGGGFIRYNLYRSDYRNTVDDLYYNHTLGAGSKILIGRMQSSVNFNPSSMQSLLSDVPMTGLRLGTADEQVDHSYGKRFFRYYSPANGTVEVHRNGELVYATATRAGYGEINQEKLPAGQYNAFVVVKNTSGDIISSQNVLINNSGAFNNNFAWHFFAGRSDAYYNNFAREEQKIIDAGFQIPVSTFSAAYLGGTVIEKNSIFSTGAILKNEHISTSVKAGFGNDNFHYYELNSYLDNLSVSWKKVSTGKKWGDQHTKSDNTTFSASYNVGLSSQLSASMGYTYSSGLIYNLLPDESYTNDRTYEKRHSAPSYLSVSKSIFASVYYNFDNGSTLYVNANRDVGSENYGVSFGVSIPLGEHVRISSVSNYNNDGKLTNNSTVDYSNMLSDSWFQTISAGTYMADTGYNTLTYNIAHNSDVFRGSAYIYATDKGQRQASLSADSTQVINGSGIYFAPSSWQDSAFITRARGANYDVSVRNMTDNTTRYPDAGTGVISVPSYNKILVTSDTDSSRFVFSDRQSKHTNILSMVPGSSFVISGKTISTNTVIMTLRNEKGEYALSASCTDDSCISVSRLSQGVFKVKYTGTGFTVRSGNAQCYADNVRNAKFISVNCDRNEQGKR
ncbi:TcfC E-set like domain-containing protein [Salmonella enterica]|nr:TcfC E-set like domain-containing protein [Salmonella enterica]EMD3918243.1 TcfC E-set like domain-containing protein [Salmonella enterica]